MQKKECGVFVPANVKPKPKEHEISAAYILADYFKDNVIFRKTYSTASPDIEVSGILWEIKSPRGKGRDNIHKNMREASKQSENIVIDLRQSKLHSARALGHIREYLKRPNRLKRVLVITKKHKVLAIK